MKSDSKCCVIVQKIQIAKNCFCRLLIDGAAHFSETEVRVVGNFFKIKVVKINIFFNKKESISGKFRDQCNFLKV